MVGRTMASSDHRLWFPDSAGQAAVGAAKPFIGSRNLTAGVSAGVNLAHAAESAAP
jgi:hypothetical protein